MAKPVSPPLCAYCGNPARLVTGAVIYPGRPELKDKPVWFCQPCDAWVGCHPGTEQPLGRLANRELRKAKMAAHAAFDPLWLPRVREGASKKTARNTAYEWLARELGIERKDCHIGHMDVAMCRRVVEACNARKKEIAG